MQKSLIEVFKDKLKSAIISFTSVRYFPCGQLSPERRANHVQPLGAPCAHFLTGVKLMKTPITERGGLTKMTFSFYRNDLAYLRKRFKHNQAAGVREIVRKWIDRDRKRRE